MSVFAEEEKKKVKNAKPAAQPKETVQRDLSDVNGPEGGMLPDSVSAKIQSKRGTGQRLSDRNLQQYSHKFGRDMSDVHVHTDAESDTISRSLNARAFTIGSDVFLTKGIDPDGGGRDAQTMSHELAHVVQQGGHAGSGRLKLGAADTAQEHEAESTARREYSPELDEEDGTIQRGFFSDFGKMIGHNVLGAFGMEDAYNATFGAKHKVQAAVKKLDEATADTFRRDEATLKIKESHFVNIEKAAKDSPDDAQKQKDYGEAKSELAELRKKQLKIVQKVDSSITDDDMIQYRNDNSSGSMALGVLGGHFMAGFAKGSDKEKARAAGIKSSAGFGAGEHNYTPQAEVEEDPEEKAQKEKQAVDGLIQEVWRDIQDDAQYQQLKDHFDNQLLFKRKVRKEHSDLIKESLADETPQDEIKKAVLASLNKEVERSNQPAGSQSASVAAAPAPAPGAPPPAPAPSPAPAAPEPDAKPAAGPAFDPNAMSAEELQQIISQWQKILSTKQSPAGKKGKRKKK